MHNNNTLKLTVCIYPSVNMKAYNSNNKKVVNLQYARMIKIRTYINYGL